MTRVTRQPHQTAPWTRRDAAYRVVIALIRLSFWLIGLRIDLRGLEHVPRRGPAILVSNHTGYLDFTFVGLAGHRRGRLVRFLAKQPTFDHPLSGPPMRAMGHIPVRRPDGTVAARRAARALAAGEVVGVFPEATISRSWTLKPYRRGAAYLACRLGVPLVPIVVWGGHRVLTVDGRWSLRRGRAVTITVGEPLHPSAGDDVARVSDRLRERMDELLAQAQAGYPDRPVSPADHWWLPTHLGGSAPTPERAAELDRLAVARADSGRRRGVRRWPR